MDADSLCRKSKCSLWLVLYIHSFTSADSTNRGLFSNLEFTIERNPGINGPMQFKFIKLKGQLYMLNVTLPPTVVCLSKH